MATRFKSKLFLLESTIIELTGSKLQSLGMVLCLFLYHHIELNKTIRELTAFTVREVQNICKRLE